MNQSIGAGILAGGLFFFVGLFLGAFIPGGESGAGPIYAGITLLCGTLVACTHIIVTKLNALLGENKEETKENNHEH